MRTRCAMSIRARTTGSPRGRIYACIDPIAMTHDTCTGGGVHSKHPAISADHLVTLLAVASSLRDVFSGLPLSGTRARSSSVADGAHADMAKMQVRHPITIFVQMKSDSGLLLRKPFKPSLILLVVRSKNSCGTQILSSRLSGACGLSVPSGFRYRVQVNKQDTTN